MNIVWVFSCLAPLLIQQPKHYLGASSSSPSTRAPQHHLAMQSWALEMVLGPGCRDLFLETSPRAKARGISGIFLGQKPW